MITAHAGAENTRDNTRESLEVLIKLGADAVELDVRKLASGALALSHDEIGPLEHVFTLEAALSMIVPVNGLYVNLDMKQTGLLAEAVKVAEKTGVLQRILVTGSVSDADIRAAARFNVPIWYNEALIPEGEDPFEALRIKGLKVLNIDWRHVSEEMLLRHASELSVWTVDDMPLQRRFLQAGVQNLTTRRPLQALSLRAAE